MTSHEASTSNNRAVAAAITFATALAGLLVGESAFAQTAQVYVPLAQPCRLLDTRTTSGGPGPLTQAHGNYVFGTDNASIAGTAQNGSATGCGIPTGIKAISANLNMINATGAGNIRSWADDQGTTGPAAGTGVYNPSVASPQPGQALYNTGYSTIAVGAGDGGFYVSIANGQIDMTVNVTGYWLALTSAASSAGIGVYNAGTGLALSANNFSVAPTYRLPQGCAANQVSQWNGSTWICATLPSAYVPPAGLVNQTLRFSATNTLAANSLLQSFSDGGLIAGGTHGTGTIPTAADGTRMMWYPAKAAFRVGTFSGNSAADVSIGDSSIAMGFSALASGSGSISIGPAIYNSGDNSLALGYGSDVQADDAVAINGGHAYGFGSFALGAGNYADGLASMAIGTSAQSGGHIYDFVYSDNSATTTNDADHQFMVRASGGYKFYTSSGNTGVLLSAGSGSWSNLSDRHAKDTVEPVDARAVLAKVAAMPLATWHYKTQDAQYRHMGPMAQDFYAAFKLGESDTGIDTVDADGVALAAIQGLNALIAEKDAKASHRLEEKDREIAALRAEASAQKSRVAALESIADDLADVKAQIAALRRTAPVMVALHP